MMLKECKKQIVINEDDNNNIDNINPNFKLDY